MLCWVMMMKEMTDVHVFEEGGVQVCWWGDGARDTLYRMWGIHCHTQLHWVVVVDEAPEKKPGRIFKSTSSGYFLQRCIFYLVIELRMHKVGNWSSTGNLNLMVRYLRPCTSHQLSKEAVAEVAVQLLANYKPGVTYIKMSSYSYQSNWETAVKLPSPSWYQLFLTDSPLNAACPVSLSCVEPVLKKISELSFLLFTAETSSMTTTNNPASYAPFSATSTRTSTLCEKKTSLDKPHNPGFLMGLNDMCAGLVRHSLGTCG